MPEQLRFLVVDDDGAVGLVLKGLLQQAGASAIAVADAESALAELAQSEVDCVITDLRMPGMDGMELLSRVNRDWPEIPVVVLTAHGTIASAVEAMKRGASDFLTKPFERDDLLRLVDKVTRMERPSAPPPAADAEKGLLGSSVPVRQLREIIRRAARGQSTVLICGETGTGKELVARAIHRESPRADGPLVIVHCAALPDSLLESELFGYEKGAFTGASAAKPGRVALADRGTLFLDEIGDVSPVVQVKLLRLLQEREYEVLGGTKVRKADVRFIAATHRDLEADVAAGRFREDLFYRLNVIPIRAPPLSERGDDVLELAEHFRIRACLVHGRDVRLAPAALAELSRHPWPGNVRELSSTIERIVVFAEDKLVDAEDVRRELGPAERARPHASRPARATGADKDEILRVLKRTGNNRSLAARLLGVSRRTLYNRLTAFGIKEGSGS